MSDEPSIDPQPGQIADGMVEIHGATEIVDGRAAGISPGAGDLEAGGSTSAEGGTPVPDLTGRRSPEPLDAAADLGSGGGSTTADPGRQHPIDPGSNLDE
jgi:hypothetical protein